jgi:hypothetical protein
VLPRIAALIRINGALRAAAAKSNWQAKTQKKADVMPPSIEAA